MAKKSTPGKQFLPGMINLLTLAALLGIVGWASQQRPAMPTGASPQLLGASQPATDVALTAVKTDPAGTAGPANTVPPVAAVTRHAAPMAAGASLR